MFRASDATGGAGDGASRGKFASPGIGSGFPWLICCYFYRIFSEVNVTVGLLFNFINVADFLKCSNYHCHSPYYGH